MAYFEWKETFSTGNAEVDGQHKILIEHVNKLYEAMMEGKGKQQLEETLDALIKYVDYHFTTEEQHFTQIDYPEKQHHIQEHQGLRNKVLDFQQQFKAGRTLLSTELLHVLTSWVRDHILKVDMTYKGLF